MKQEELKQRLIELVAKSRASMRKESGLNCDLARNYYFAEFLIANGVTIRERGEWVWNSEEKNCPKCGGKPLYREGGTSFARSFYRAKSNFCPHCGSDMRGVTKTPETEKGGEG